jgi:hypothetical protein
MFYAKTVDIIVDIFPRGGVEEEILSRRNAKGFSPQGWSLFPGHIRYPVN